VLGFFFFFFCFFIVHDAHYRFLPIDRQPDGWKWNPVCSLTSAIVAFRDTFQEMQS